MSLWSQPRVEPEKRKTGRAEDSVYKRHGKEFAVAPQNNEDEYLEGEEEELEEAYELGYEEARRHYEVSYWCAKCGEDHLSITTDEEKSAAAEFMYQQGWHDPGCAQS